MPTPKQYPDRAARQKAYRERLARARQLERQAKGLPAAPTIPSLPARRRWSALLAHAHANLQSARDEMEDYFNDRSESWQDSEPGEDWRTRIDALDELLDALQDLLL
jgi:hypothetical protein